MKRPATYLLLSAIVLFGASSSMRCANLEAGNDCDSGGVRAFTTTANSEKLLSSEHIKFDKRYNSSATIIIDDNVKFQPITGFGAAITGSTCYNLLQMDQAECDRFLTECFDPQKGMGFNFIRVSIGASDFSMDEYTWCDEAPIENFEIHRYDREHLLPILHKILAINPNIKIIGSPWSAPRWMKVGVEDLTQPHYRWTSGRLNPACYASYGEYFVLWLKAMADQGVDVEYITIQNEPLNKGNSMSMFMPYEDQQEFLKSELGPRLRAAGLDTKVLVYDHNYDYQGNNPLYDNYPLHIYDDPDAAQYVYGSAWHNYGGKVSELEQIYDHAPNKAIYFTEASIGSWNYTFNKTLINDFKNVFVETLNRHCRGVTLWNLMLDENGAPNRPGGCQTCFGVVDIDSQNYSYSSIRRNSQFYAISHCSKVISAGANRVETSRRLPQDVAVTFFDNNDGTYAGVLVNSGGSDRVISVADERRSFDFELPAKSIVSLEWNK